MWDSIASPPMRAHHTVSLVRGSTAIVAAGVTYDDSNYNSWKTSHDLWLFDADGQNWTKYEPDVASGPGLVDAATNASLDRGFAAFDTFRGQMYYGFGVACATESFMSCAAFSNSIYRTNWSSTRLYVDRPLSMHHVTDLPAPGRVHPALVITSQGDLIVALGSTRYENLDDAWRYHIDTGKWTMLPPFAYAAHHPYGFHIGATTYVGFGHGADIYPTLYRYDVGDASWSSCTPLPAQGRVAGTHFSHKGRGYILGGEGSMPFHYALTKNEFWEFTPTNTGGVWRELPAATGTGWWAPTSFVIADTVYYALGVNRPYGVPASSQTQVLSFGPLGGRNCSTIEEEYFDARCCDNVEPDDVAVCRDLVSEYDDRQCCNHE